MSLFSYILSAFLQEKHCLVGFTSDSQLAVQPRKQWQPQHMSVIYYIKYHYSCNSST